MYLANQSGSAFSDMQVVRIAGSQGTRLTAVLAQADSSANAGATIAVVTEPIANGASGFATISGLVRNVDTSGFSEGDPLYLSAAVAGGITNVIPTSPNKVVRIGWCVRSHATVGMIYVQVAKVYVELDDLGRLPAVDGSQLLNLPVPAQKIRNQARFVTSAYAFGSATIPDDDTIPQQSTEGNQFMALAYTPTAADSIMEIRVLANLDNQSGTYTMSGALFQDAIEDALATGRAASYFTSGVQLEIKYWVTAGSTAERTYKFKAGTPSAVVTAFNGYTARKLGGTLSSFIEITEYAP